MAHIVVQQYDNTRIIIFTGYRTDVNGVDAQFNTWVSQTPNIHIVDIQLVSSSTRDALSLMVRYVEV